MSANDRQVGGNHYKQTESVPQHWDLAVLYNWDFFQYQITKYVMRWKDKGGLVDLEKAQHFLEKYIEVVKAGYRREDIQLTPRYDFSWVSPGLIRCRRCGELLHRPSFEEAYELHGDCPTKAYVAQD